MTEKRNNASNVPTLRFPGFEDEWYLLRLDEVSNIGRGKSKHRPRDSDFLYGGKYPFIQTGDIRKANLYLTEFSQTYSEKGLEQSKLWDENTLCITIAANIAETAILKIKACFPDSVIGLIPKNEKTDVLFVKYLFDKFKIQIKKLSQGAAQDNLNQEKLSKLQFYFPSLKEQQKIISFISLLDERIETQNKIIEELKLLKSTLCNLLFSQEAKFNLSKRVYSNWKSFKLEDVFEALKGNGISKEKLSITGMNKCVLYGELYTKYSEVIDEVVSKTNVSEGTKSKYGDLLIPSSTTTTGIDLANVSTILDNNVLLGGDITILRSRKELNSMFYAYYLTNRKKKELASYSQGSTIVHLYYNHFKEMLIDFPEMEEQNKIAKMLFFIDKRRNYENEILVKYESQKKYLLSKLFI